MLHPKVLVPRVKNYEAWFACTKAITKVASPPKQKSKHNENCPLCRKPHHEGDDLWHRKVIFDKATNKLQSVKMRNDTGVFLLSGKMRDKDHLNDLFCGKQVPPMVGAEFDPSQQQRVSDTLVFSVAPQDIAEEFNAAVELAMTTKNTSFYSWRSQVAHIFAVQCNECRAVCYYEWHKSTTKVDKLSAIRWFTAFLDGSSTACDDLVSRKKNKTPLCARWGRNQFGQNGIVDEEDVEADIDEEDVEGEDVEDVDMEETAADDSDDSDSDEDEQTNGDDDWTLVGMEPN